MDEVLARREQLKMLPICPDANHTFDYCWDRTVRYCTKCPYRQFQFQCNNDNQWQHHIPATIYNARPDISKNVEFDLSQIRQKGSITTNILEVPIQLIGAGGIGSFTALALMKMGFHAINIFDGDNVAVENLGTQMYGCSDAGLGKHLQPNGHGALVKSEAITATLKDPSFSVDTRDALIAYAHYSLMTYGRLKGVIISAVDSMKVRKQIWDAHKNHKDTKWLIDARMGGEQAILYAVNPNSPRDIRMYEKTLHTDEQAWQDPCTARATVFTGLLIAGMIAKTVRDCLSERTNYPRVMHWDIAQNCQQIFTLRDVKRRPRKKKQIVLDTSREEPIRNIV